MDVPNMEDNGGVSKCAQVYDNASCLSATRRSRHSRHSTKTNAPSGSGSHVSLQHLFRSFNVGCWRDSTRHRWKTWCSHLTHQFWTTITPGSVVTSISCSADPKKSEIDWFSTNLMPLRPLPPSSPMEFQTWWHEERSVPLRRLHLHLTSSIFSCHDAESAMWTHVACYCYVHPYPTPKQKTPAANVHLMSSGHLSYLLCKPSIYKISVAAAS